MYINLPKMSKNVIFKPFYAITQILCYFMLKIQFYNNFHDFTPSGSPGKGAFKLASRELLFQQIQIYKANGLYPSKEMFYST